MMSAECQTTLIPDAAFEQALIDLELDDELDGSVLTENISGLMFLDVFNKNIQDMTGIEDFEALVNFECSSNDLDTLDVSFNQNLLFLTCANNNLTSLIMPEASPVFRELFANDNNLTHLEITNYAGVAWISATNNQLTSVDLSGSNVEFVTSFENNLLSEINLEGAVIEYLVLSNNNFSSLDLSEHPELETFFALDNPNLECIKVSQEQLDNIPGSWNIDATTDYAIDCLALSIDPVSHEPKIALFPNPVKSILLLENRENVEVERITVLDILGKTVLIEKNNFEILDFSELENGVLFVQIETENGIVTKRIIKE